MSNRNAPSANHVPQAPAHERAIRNRLDEAIDETFPASDPPSLTDPTRRPATEPVLPADARPGDVIEPPASAPTPPRGDPDRGPDEPAIAPPKRDPAPSRPPLRDPGRAPKREAAAVVAWVWPWLLLGVAAQAWWIWSRRAERS